MQGSKLMYRPVDSAKSEIRLLIIHPLTSSPRRSHLRCDLELYRYHDAPPYRAISYAWSDRPSAKTVFINGVEHTTSEVVERILRQVRQKQDMVYVWIDQICINQLDNEEKSAQVLLMSHIYQHAANVVVWLGPSFRNSQILFDFLRQVAATADSHEWDELWDLVTDKVLAKQAAAALERLCDNAYWKRLWTIQEYVFARNITIMCGNACISGTTFLAALTVDEAVKSASSLSESMNRKSLVSAVGSIILPPGRSFVANAVVRRKRFWESEIDRDSFADVLTTALSLETDNNLPLATDPRDRVLALLHLASDGSDYSHLVDYSLSCEELYRKTSLGLIRKGHLDILRFCQFPKRLPGLPSWTVDWSMPLRKPCTCAIGEDKFLASGTTELDGQPWLHEECSRLLKLDGYEVDSIRQVGNLWDPDWTRPPDTAAILEYIDEIASFCKQSVKVGAGEEIIQALRVATCDAARWGKDEDNERDFLSYLGHFTYAYHRLLNGQTVDKASGSDRDEPSNVSDTESSSNIGAGTGDLDDWFIDAIHHLHSRRPFITRTGFVGLGPAHLKPDDRVCLFQGARVPYLVRDQQGGNSILLGEAFVHGIMYGEWMRGMPELHTYVLV